MMALKLTDIWLEWIKIAVGTTDFVIYYAETVGVKGIRVISMN